MLVVEPDEVYDIFTGTGTLGAAHTVPVSPFLVHVYFVAT